MKSRPPKSCAKSFTLRPPVWVVFLDPVTAAKINPFTIAFRLVGDGIPKRIAHTFFAPILGSVPALIRSRLAQWRT